jgi:hypothetical protein
MGKTALEKSVGKLRGNRVIEKRLAPTVNRTQQVREARLEMAAKLFAFKQSMQRCGIGPEQWDHYFTRFNNW